MKLNDGENFYLHKFSTVHEGGARTDYLSVAVARSSRMSPKWCVSRLYWVCDYGD